MPSDPGLVTPPLQGGAPPPQLITGAGGQSGGKPPLSRNAKIGIGIGGFLLLALGAYEYSKHKASSSSSTTGTANTAPEVIAPSTDQDALPASGNSTGSGGGTFTGRGNLATELAQIQSELLALQTGQNNVNPGGPMIPASPGLVLPSGQLLAPGPPPGSVTAANNQAAEDSYVSTVGITNANAYTTWANQLSVAFPGGFSNPPTAAESAWLAAHPAPAQ